LIDIDIVLLFHFFAFIIAVLTWHYAISWWCPLILLIFRHYAD
jgi:hypothetical protein